MQVKRQGQIKGTPLQTSLFDEDLLIELEDKKAYKKKRKIAISHKADRQKEYKSWKGIDGLKQAEEIDEQLRVELARAPRKKDFIAAGQYNAWMALYRYRNKTVATLKDKGNLEDIYTNEIRSLVALTKNYKLLEKIIEDIINNLGPERTEKILKAINGKRGWNV